MIKYIVGLALIFLGLFFIIMAAVGILRLPDFYSRLHANGKSETLGIMSCLLGVAVLNGLNMVSFKVILIALFLFFVNPVGSHLISRGTYKSGVPIWQKEENKK